MPNMPSQDTDVAHPSEYLVSIIIPVYNVEEFLAQCLTSVINQSYSNIEVICVVDGSTDASEAIARDFDEQDNRVRVVTQANQGLSVARNTGVSLASGEYVFFLDSDDWLEKNAIQNLVNAAKQSGCKVVSGAVTEYWQSSGKTKPYWREDKRKCGYLLLHRQDFFLLEDMVWNKLYQREVVDVVPFVPQLIHEDLEFYWRVFSEFSEVYAIKETVVWYRRREGTLSSAKQYDEGYQRNFIKIFDSARSAALKYPHLQNVLQRKALKYLKQLQKKQAPHAEYQKHIRQYGIHQNPFFYFWLSIKTRWDRLLT